MSVFDDEMLWEQSSWEILRPKLPPSNRNVKNYHLNALYNISSVIIVVITRVDRFIAARRTGVFRFVPVKCVWFSMRLSGKWLRGILCTCTYGIREHTHTRARTRDNWFLKLWILSIMSSSDRFYFSRPKRDMLQHNSTAGQRSNTSSKSIRQNTCVCVCVFIIIIII